VREYPRIAEHPQLSSGLLLRRPMRHTDTIVTETMVTLRRIVFLTVCVCCMGLSSGLVQSVVCWLVAPNHNNTICSCGITSA
jgi:hypothetical protein